MLPHPFSFSLFFWGGGVGCLSTRSLTILESYFFLDREYVMKLVVITDKITKAWVLKLRNKMKMIFII